MREPQADIWGNTFLWRIIAVTQGLAPQKAESRFAVLEIIIKRGTIRTVATGVATRLTGVRANHLASLCSTKGKKGDSCNAPPYEEGIKT
ncbi:MAG: hypothetical protein D3925_16440 [Candidatus Electrothrix sp. AR5]|nr:hypothetical protein [Candidatus Electrothrix sp. AR5]